MQINGLGNSQSGDMRYMNNRTQYQNASDKTEDTEEAVILTLSSMAEKETKKTDAVSAESRKEETTTDWFREIIERVKAFFAKIWNDDSTQSVTEEILQPMEAQQALSVDSEQESPSKESISEDNLVTTFLEIIKRFLANPFSDEPIIPAKPEPPKEQSKQTSFAAYAAANGWDEKQVAHQMQMKSQVWDTYNKKGEPSRMTREPSSNLSIKH